MKVTLLCSNLRFGGIQKVALTLADELAKRDDLSVDLAVLRGGGEFMSMHSAAVRVVDIDCTSQPLALLSPFSRLARYFREAKPDVVVSFGNSTNCLAAWAKLLRRFPFRLIVSEHSAFGTRMANDSKLQQRRRVLRTRMLYRQSDLCVCVSRCVADELVGLGVVAREKARVIYNSIDFPRLNESMLGSVDHPWLQGDPSRRPPVILSVGRLMRLKGLDTLIRAFARLRRDLGVEARLMIVGEGGDRGRLEALVRELEVDGDVCLAGYTPNPYAYMGRAALVALTSHYEGLPNVLMEALACGVNVVSVDCRCGPHEILEDGKWGRLVPVGDDEALATAMRDALAAPQPAEFLRRRAAFFSTERFIEAWHAAICEPPVA